MFDLKISDIDHSNELIENWATKSIGLIDPEECKYIPDYSNYLKVYFHDWEDELRPNSYATPKEHHVKSILEFSKIFCDNDRILVHCHAGISRSTAVAIAILVQHGIGVESAFEKTFLIRPCMHPNRLVLQHAENILELNGEILKYYRNWHRTLRYKLQRTHPNYEFLGLERKKIAPA